MFVAFLDIKKAFDTVWHTGLFRKLTNVGITGHLLNTIREAYKGMSSAVTWQGMTSHWFPVESGVRQGGVLSTFLYQTFIDNLLDYLSKSKHGAVIDRVPSGNPTLADDITLISTSPRSLQHLLNICQEYSMKWKFEFSDTKCKVLVIGNYIPRNPNETWTLGHHTLDISHSQTHLGTVFSSKLSNTERITNACDKGRITLHSIVGVAPSLSAISPVVKTSLYKKVVLPSILYGCEHWTNLTVTEISKIACFQHYAVKLILGLPRRTRSDIAESILGLFRISAEVDRRKLLFLQKMIAMDQSYLPKQIFTIRLHLYISVLPNTPANHKGYFPDIVKVLRKYNLLYYLETYLRSYIFPTKSQWKRIVKSTIRSYENSALKERMANDNDFSFFQKIHCSYDLYSLWHAAESPSDMQNIYYICSVLALPSGLADEQCPLCTMSHDVAVIHLCADCIVNIALKQSFMEDILITFGPTVFHFIERMDATAFTRTILGANTGIPFIDDTDYEQFLMKSVRFVARVTRCLL
ncbi:hypothetical protein CI610_03305 [invertebrate metagenome]|uniref:Reverse transcriptase domain-containing protein n=1 Tax=invertebrate metagenome TaxID=1711999 RepID=A0A2H9T3F6_9ZZZZ